MADGLLTCSSTTLAGLLLAILKARVLNLQNEARAWIVGRHHYDLGNDFFTAMLDESMAYSCGYWADAATLNDAQTAKLDLVCRKLGLEPGMRLLDVGCGWGSLLAHAAQRYGARCVGLTISQAQAELARTRCAGLPVEVALVDYRRYAARATQRFDRIASVGMFEHVGCKNYPDFFKIAHQLLAADGLMLLHTIGKTHHRGTTDPWTNRYIFPNGQLPVLGSWYWRPGAWRAAIVDQGSEPGVPPRRPATARPLIPARVSDTALTFP